MPMTILGCESLNGVVGGLQGGRVSGCTVNSLVGEVHVERLRDVVGSDDADGFAEGGVTHGQELESWRVGELCVTCKQMCIHTNTQA